MIGLTGSPANTESSAKRGRAFRLDINALRALSVIAVVGFHLKIPGFAGGFTGVDVFLVITGYLMAGKVLKDLTLGRFSMWGFGIMRMRRIYPALAVVTIVSVIVGWFVTMPDQYLKHVQQALSALAFVSNFAFSSDSGYFSMAAQTKPLLHTWSLSVEWQFYIGMPLAVALIWRLTAAAKSKIDAILFAFEIVAAASLAWCLWKSHVDATGSSFFSLGARAWEPLVGGMIAVAEIRRGAAIAGWVETRPVAIAGWALVAACVADPLPEFRWPNAVTILPVLGAGMIVAAHQWSSRRNIFAIAPIQRVGDWSYSIYLWHWPAWVFALGWFSLHGYSVDAPEKALIVLMSLALGCASYYLVEQPVRLRPDIWTQRRLVGTSVVVFTSGLGLVVLAFLYNGFPNRLPEYLRPAELARRLNTSRDECFRNSNSVKRARETFCSFGSDDEQVGNPTAILWGDSFANQYLEPITATTRADGIRGLIATQSGCRAFMDDPARNSGDLKPCRDFNRATLDFILRTPEPRIVVLGSNWVNGIEVSALVDKLLSSGKVVIMIMPLLNLGFDLPQRWIENQVRAGGAIPEWKVKENPDLMMSGLRGEMVQTLSAHKGDKRLVVIDPQPVVCEQGYCYLVRNGEANFRDKVHISNVNAIQYRSVFHVAFKAALDAAAEQDSTSANVRRTSPGNKP